ncbi:hypothetical protein B484DRAFT_389735 [Ochromonadaceae sp. CCMP2298]|nr:hypothetical protein B484DRAFT_389735 [Ochromonadaceae sp. CCMP2298]
MTSFARQGGPALPNDARKRSTEEVEDILQSMLGEQSDHVFSRFSDAYIKYRKVVVLWMVDVADYFNLHLTTTHAAIAYLDRLQPNEKYTRFEWQMMVCATQCKKV